MAKPQIDKTLTALAGEFFVAAQLCLRGYVASLTLKNYPRVDIFCLNPKNGQQVAIQVKTIRGGQHYYVPEEVDMLKHPFVFVHISSDNSLQCFVVPSKEVAELSAMERDEYLNKHAHVRKEQPRMLSVQAIQKYKDRWELLGLD